MTERFLAFADAVEEIAQHLIAEDAYLVTIPPTLIGTITARLAAMPASDLYIDGGHEIWHTADPVHAAQVCDRIATRGESVVAVAVIPKRAAPRALLQAALDIATDEPGKDVFALHGGGQLGIQWPRLFTEATRDYDAVSYAAFRNGSAAWPA